MLSPIQMIILITPIKRDDVHVICFGFRLFPLVVITLLLQESRSEVVLPFNISEVCEDASVNI